MVGFLDADVSDVLWQYYDADGDDTYIGLRKVRHESRWRHVHPFIL